MTQKIPMTKEGYEKLKQELDHIVKVERAKNIRDIEEARAHGDLSENAEYHAAKERQGISTPRNASWSRSSPMPRSSTSRSSRMKRSCSARR